MSSAPIEERQHCYPLSAEGDIHVPLLQQQKMGQRGTGNPCPITSYTAPRAFARLDLSGPRPQHKREKLSSRRKKLQSKVTPPTGARGAPGARAAVQCPLEATLLPAGAAGPRAGKPLRTPSCLRGPQAAARLLPDLLSPILTCHLPQATRARLPLHLRSMVTDKGCRLSISLRLSSSCTPRVGLRRFWGERQRGETLLLLLGNPQTPSSSHRSSSPVPQHHDHRAALGRGKDKVTPVLIVPSAPGSVPTPVR